MSNDNGRGGNGKPPKTRREKTLATNPKARAFLAAMEITGNITAAARAIATDRRRHYFWMKSIPEYQAAFDEAMETSMDLLEGAARDRAEKGLRKYKFHNGKPILIRCDADDPEAVEATGLNGEPCHVKHYYEHEYSDQLMMFLLNGRRSEIFKHRSQVIADVTVKREEMDRVREILATDEEVRVVLERARDRAGLPPGESSDPR